MYSAGFRPLLSQAENRVGQIFVQESLYVVCLIGLLFTFVKEATKLVCATAVSVNAHACAIVVADCGWEGVGRGKGSIAGLWACCLPAQRTKHANNQCGEEEQICNVRDTYVSLCFKISRAANDLMPMP